MFSSVSTIALAAFAGVSYAQTAIDPAGQGLSITQPSSDDWWVQGGQNTLAWTCRTTQIQTFTVVVINSDPKILAAPEAYLANLNNADCSETIQPNQFTPATGYTIALANPLNQSDFYAISETFEIKAAGSAYASVTTTDIGASSTGGSSSSAGATGTSGSPPSASSGAATRNQLATGLFSALAGLMAFLA